MYPFVRGLPKAELHVHVEGTLEPETMLRLAARNGRRPPFATVEAARRAYVFADLAAFLAVYEAGLVVLRTERDFHDLAAEYLDRAAADGVVRAEIFFDPQAHTRRGVPLDAVIDGLTAALYEAQDRLGISSALIACFQRDLGPDAAARTLDALLDRQDRILGVGLDAAEVGHPPRDFAAVFARARAAGLRAVAHAGEEGPPDYVVEALDLLRAERIDHGVRAGDDPALVERLFREGVPLTVCPLSNVKLGVVPRLADHNLREFLARGVRVSLHSDDPAYFGGYIAANFDAAREALHLTDEEIVRLARNSIEGAFVDDAERERLLAKLARYVAEARDSFSRLFTSPA